MRTRHFAGRYSRAIVVALGFIGGGFAQADPAGAQSAQQLKWCNGDGHPTADLSIDGCTALIRSGKYSGRNLAIAYTNRGSSYDDKRDEDRAIADHDSAIRIDPKLDLAFNNRANAYGRKGETDRALADYDKAVRLNPKFALAYNNRGLEYREKREFDAAIADFSTAIAIDSRYANAYRNRGNAYVKMDEYDRALPDLTTALAINARDPETLAGRGIAYQKIGDYDSAIADFDSVIAREPHNIAAFTSRGYAHFYRGDFVDAVADLSHVVGTDLDTYPNLFRFLALSRAGQTASDLEPAARRLNSRTWPYAVFELYLGRRDPAATLAAAQQPEQRCEAQFYVGEWQLLQGDRAA